ncbi:MAG: class I SAM-dependent methyltransferase [bacterium]
MPANDFYDDLAPFYHMICRDWEKSVVDQAAALDAIIKENWGAGVKDILDVSCGIGTQALGLSALGYNLTASDPSAGAIARAKSETEKRGLKIDFSVADMRDARDCDFDLVISCDNSVPHLLTDDDILTAFRRFYSCVRPGGGVLISVRDYDREIKTGTVVKPYDPHEEDGAKYTIFQIWNFEGDIYDMSLYIAEDAGDIECDTRVFKTKYYAIGTDKLISLMSQAGFSGVMRIDNKYFQPVIIGKKT